MSGNIIYFAGLEDCRPRRFYQHDAGTDLVVAANTRCLPGAITEVPSGIAIALPEGSFGLILGRSSTAMKRGLIVIPSVIDSGFRGALFTAVYNPLREEVALTKGSRISQIIVVPFITADFVYTTKLPGGERDERGVGSSGQGIEGGGL